MNNWDTAILLFLMFERVKILSLRFELSGLESKNVDILIVPIYSIVGLHSKYKRSLRRFIVVRASVRGFFYERQRS